MVSRIFCYHLDFLAMVYTFSCCCQSHRRAETVWQTGSVYCSRITGKQTADWTNPSDVFASACYECCREGSRIPRPSLRLSFVCASSRRTRQHRVIPTEQLKGHSHGGPPITLTVVLVCGLGRRRPLMRKSVLKRLGSFSFFMIAPLRSLQYPIHDPRSNSERITSRN